MVVAIYWKMASCNIFPPVSKWYEDVVKNNGNEKMSKFSIEFQDLVYMETFQWNNISDNDWRRFISIYGTQYF